MPENEDIEIENYSTEDAMRNIQDIAETGLENAKSLKNIETSLDSINDHVSSLDDYLVIQKKKEEEKNKEEDLKEEKKEEEISEKNASNEVEEEEITLSDIHSEMQIINDNLTYQNNLLTISIFSSGIIIGVLLITLFWNRFIK